MGVEVFDDASGKVSGLLGQSAQEWTDAWVPELLAWVEEIPAGLFLKGWGRTIAGVVAGAIALGWGTVASGRDKKLALELAAHWLTHPNAPGLFGFVSVAAVTPASMAAEIDSLRTGIAAGNLELVRDSLTFTPADVDAYFRTAMARFQALWVSPLSIGALEVVPGPAPATTAEATAQQLESVIGYGDVF